MTTRLINPTFNFTPCPCAVPDWLDAYLALIDRAGRLLLLATLPKPTGAVALTQCVPFLGWYADSE